MSLYLVTKSVMSYFNPPEGITSNNALFYSIASEVAAEGFGYLTGSNVLGTFCVGVFAGIAAQKWIDPRNPLKFEDAMIIEGRNVAAHIAATGVYLIGAGALINYLGSNQES